MLAMVVTSLVLSPITSLWLSWFTPYEWRWMTLGADPIYCESQFVVSVLAIGFAFLLRKHRHLWSVSLLFFLYIAAMLVAQSFMSLSVRASEGSTAVLRDGTLIAAQSRGAIDTWTAVFVVEPKLLWFKFRNFRFYANESVQGLSIDEQGRLVIHLEVYGGRRGYEILPASCIDVLARNLHRGKREEACAISRWTKAPS